MMRPSRTEHISFEFRWEWMTFFCWSDGRTSIGDKIRSDPPIRTEAETSTAGFARNETADAAPVAVAWRCKWAADDDVMAIGGQRAAHLAADSRILLVPTDRPSDQGADLPPSSSAPSDCIRITWTTSLVLISQPFRPFLPKNEFRPRDRRSATLPLVEYSRTGATLEPNKWTPLTWLRQQLAIHCHLVRTNSFILLASRKKVKSLKRRQERNILNSSDNR